MSCTRLLRREYQGNLSLKTTDHCLKTSLLPNFSPKIRQKDSPKPQVTLFDNDQFLLELSSVLSSQECAEIIKNADKCIFENVSDKYRFGKQRNSSRLLTLDTTLAENLWQRIFKVLFKEIIDKEVSTQPLGFDVTRGVWDLDGLNEAIRINKYSAERKGFFGPHKDAQFCPNGDERSIMTFLIYLNEDFKGGETCFYFPKDSSLSSKGMTIKEEIKLHGGLENGYKCVKIVPKIGHAVLSSQSILHEALKVRRGTKYILKTDVVVKRSLKEFGFAVAEWEKEDYMKCLDYFRQAQQQELYQNFDVASDLYEKALSIRYCYPKAVNETPKDVDTSGYTRFPSEVWLHLFDFLSLCDVQNIVYAYPQLNFVMATWEQRRRNSSLRLCKSNVKYLPTIQYQKGVVTSFVFPDAEFFREKKNGCCRVAAMYSFFLLGHSPQDDVYTVRYNPVTQEVCVVALETLLTDIFYGRRCYGSLYNVRQQDPKNRDPEKDFEASVDRSYMLMKHGAEFKGMELPDRFYSKCVVHVTSDDENSDDDHDADGSDDGSGDDDCGDDGSDGDGSDGNGNDDEMSVADVKRKKGVYYDNVVPYNGEVGENINVAPIMRFMLMVADHNKAMCYKEDFREDISDILNEHLHTNGGPPYFEALQESMNETSAAVISKLNTPTTVESGDACICFMDLNENTADELATNCCTEYFNHLVFDFEKSELNVKINNGALKKQVHRENSREATDYKEAIMREMADVGCTGELIEAEINIEPLLSSNASFNHASCQCGHPRFELKEHYDLKNYVHLTSITLLAKEKDGQMIAWTIYDGIVAL